MSGQSGPQAGRKHVTPTESAFYIFVFVLFAVLWVGFAWALIGSQGASSQRSLPSSPSALPSAWTARTPSRSRPSRSCG